MDAIVYVRSHSASGLTPEAASFASKREEQWGTPPLVSAAVVNAENKERLTFPASLPPSLTDSLAEGDELVCFTPSPERASERSTDATSNFLSSSKRF